MGYAPSGYWWAGVDSAWEHEKLEARKMPENAAESHMSGAPWNDGGRSFSTKERPTVTQGEIKKLRFLKKMTHFSQFQGDVLRTQE